MNLIIHHYNRCMYNCIITVHSNGDYIMWYIVTMPLAPPMTWACEHTNYQWFSDWGMVQMTLLCPHYWGYHRYPASNLLFRAEWCFLDTIFRLLFLCTPIWDTLGFGMFWQHITLFTRWSLGPRLRHWTEICRDIPSSCLHNGTPYL